MRKGGNVRQREKEWASVKKLKRQNRGNECIVGARERERERGK